MLSWKPKLRGSIYCAPACGSGCTKAAYDKAVREGESLRKRLKGDGWQVHVHENMGWFYTLISGPIQVYPDRHGKTKKFWCMIGGEPEDNAGGFGLWTTDESSKMFKDPNRAVRHAMKSMSEVMTRLNHVWTRARNVAGV